MMDISKQPDLGQLLAEDGHAAAQVGGWFYGVAGVPGAGRCLAAANAPSDIHRLSTAGVLGVENIVRWSAPFHPSRPRPHNIIGRFPGPEVKWKPH